MSQLNLPHARKQQLKSEKRKTKSKKGYAQKYRQTVRESVESVHGDEEEGLYGGKDLQKRKVLSKE